MSGNYRVTKEFRLTEYEAELLKRKAGCMGMTESAYLRGLISQKPTEHKGVRVLLKQLINETNSIGNNINQIVKNNNSELYSDKDKEYLKAYLRKLIQKSEEVEKAVRDIGNTEN